MHRYTDEQKAFIREIAPGRYNQEITDLFNRRFGTSFSVGQIKAFKANHGIKSGVTKKRPNDDDGLFTKEQKDFIKNNVKGLFTRELAELVNQTFGLDISRTQMHTFKKNHGLTSGINSCFKKGRDPWNKGKKGLATGGFQTRFKKGHRPSNYKPVGTERINGEGYVDIKVADPNKWRSKHILIWEEANGPVPDGHVILFGDGNKRNFDLDNLLLVSRKQLATLNRKNLIKNDAELTKTGLLLADLYHKISDRNKSEENER